MEPAEDQIVDRLDAAERGFVLGALLLHPSGGTDLGAGLEPPSDARCGAALARIAALPRTARVKLTRQLAREAVAPIPAGIEAVDEAVLAHLLRDEPPAILRLAAQTAPLPVRQAIAARLGADPPDTLAPARPADPPSRAGAADPSAAWVRSPPSLAPAEATRPVGLGRPLEGAGVADVPDGAAAELVLELQRALFSRVVPVHPAGPTSGSGAGTAGQLLLLEPAQRTAELSRRGASVLGHSLRGARREVILRAAALAGPSWADQIIAAAGARDEGTEEGRDRKTDRTVALELVAATAPAAVPDETVTRLGARAAGARMTRDEDRGLGGADQARAVAQRLPPAIGAELLSGAGLGAELG